MNATSYSVDIRSILEELGATLSLDSEVELPSITLGAEPFVPVQPAHLVLDITNTGTGIVASGTVDVEFLAVCSRCLREFSLPLTAPVEGFYVAPGHDREIPEEQEVAYIVEGSIDLADQVLAAITLELPFAPLHDENCPGICPQCGTDLVDGACACEDAVPDSPFAALKNLLPSENDA
jgi:uncharacterized protein